MDTLLAPSLCEHICIELNVEFDVTCIHSRLSQTAHLTHDVEPGHCRRHEQQQQRMDKTDHHTVTYLAHIVAFGIPFLHATLKVKRLWWALKSN